MNSESVVDLVSDFLVELAAFHDEEIIVRFDDSTLCGYRSGCHDVVTCHHPHSDARSLTLGNRLWNLHTKKFNAFL